MDTIFKDSDAIASIIEPIPFMYSELKDFYGFF
jgi:hypothetical protein